MTVTTWLFGFTLFITVPLYWLLPAAWRQYFLLFVSLVVLTVAAPKIVFLLLCLSIFAYHLGKILYNGTGKTGLFTISLIVPVGVLAYYKYTPMLVDSLNYFSRLSNYTGKLAIPPIAVPIGISFFTFKMLHYLIVCHKKEAVAHSFWSFLLYITFFPIFTSGPIERWPHFSVQVPVFSGSTLFTGIGRILVGLFKKKVLADNLVIFANMLQSPTVSGWGYWIAAYAYAMQIYFDFSGYSDIAIGSARLYGYEIMENFNWPYLQRNISQFWKNWHITLTSWFKDYIFIPLGGSRVPLYRIILNTLAVMAVTGIWHGAAWHFMLWGLYHGCGLMIWRFYSLLIKDSISERWQKSRIVHALSIIITFNFVVLGWVFFATEFSQSLHIIGKMLFII
jgi:alginate O-acetyltransferase complex protein AlgI